MRHPHFHDRASQEAAWQAVVKVSGVDYSPARPARSRLRRFQNGPSIDMEKFIVFRGILRAVV